MPKRCPTAVANCLQHRAAQLEPGMPTLELDEMGGSFLEVYGARSAPKQTYNLPGTT